MNNNYTIKRIVLHIKIKIYKINSSVMPDHSFFKVIYDFFLTQLVKTRLFLTNFN